MTSASEAKSALRASLRSLVSPVGDESVLSTGLLTTLRGWEVWKSARSVAGFSALPGEPHALEPWLEDRKIALPRVEGDHLILHWVAGPDELVKGRFGILEPPASAPVADPNGLDLILVPGVAFDREGGRLGRGRGYYDRLLAGTSAFKVGVCFDWQIVPEVPREAHDIRMDAVVTPSNFFPAGPKSRM